MLTDLLALAHNDGCIAAAWAFEQIVQIVQSVPAKKKCYDCIAGDNQPHPPATGKE